MQADEIVTLLKRAPFEPFTLYMSDGSRYDVRHPELVIVTPRAVHVGIPGDRNPRIAADVAVCALVHVTRLEPAT